MEMKQKVVGNYWLGRLAIELVLREGDGGEFYLCPGQGKPMRMKIGAYEPGQWAQVVVTFLHEAMEAAYELAGLRYTPSGLMEPKSHAHYQFMLNHEQFHACVAQVGDLMAEAMPDLGVAWKKFVAPPPKRKKKPLKKKAKKRT